jgi:hypothetical protein
MTLAAEVTEPPMVLLIAKKMSMRFRLGILPVPDLSVPIKLPATRFPCELTPTILIAAPL